MLGFLSARKECSYRPVVKRTELVGCMKMGVCLTEEHLQVALGFLSSLLLSPRRGQRGLGQEKRERHTKFNNEIMTQTFLHKFIKSLENHNEWKSQCRDNCLIFWQQEGNTYFTKFFILQISTLGIVPPSLKFCLLELISTIKALVLFFCKRMFLKRISFFKLTTRKYQ